MLILLDKRGVFTLADERRRVSSRRAEYERRHKQKMRRLRNRTIIIVAVLLVVVLFFWLVVSAFKGCTSGCSKDKPQISTAPVAATQPSTENKKKTATADEFPTSRSLTFDAPNIEDDGSDGVMDGSLYVWNKSAFELFYGNDELAATYADLMNTAANKLGSDIKLYSMIVPNHTEMGLPARLKNTENGANTLSQADYIRSAYNGMNSSVQPVNVYNALSSHCNEYIYFHSDHHWTGLGAYYSYAAFMEQIGKTPLDLESCEGDVIDGFTGSFLKLVTSGVSEDSVEYWKFPYDAPMTITSSSGEKANYDSPYCSYAEGGDYTYSVFIYGDNPLTVIKSSSDNADDEKILVVHESYGNALIPYLTNNFSEVYAIDFRDWTGSIKDFCEQNDITNVLFLNGVMSSATTVQVDSMKGIL